MRRSEARQEHQQDLLLLPVRMLRHWLLGSPIPRSHYQAIKDSMYQRLIERVEKNHRIKVWDDRSVEREDLPGGNGG